VNDKQVNDKQLNTGFAMPKFEEWNTVRKWQRAARVVGPLIAASFTLWFLLGLLGFVPSIIQVFGQTEVKIPAAIVVAGLLIGALGYWDD
jgi:hypothetical protein